MPSTIPYDPSLVMGELANKQALENVEHTAGYQAKADAAQDKYNELLTSKRSLDTPLIELPALTELPTLKKDKDDIQRIENGIKERQKATVP